jgi:hypothetical protein
MSGLAKLLQAQFGFKTRPIDPEDNIVVGVTVLPVIAYNPNRVALTFQNNGATTMYLKTNRNLIVGTGIRLLPNGGSISYVWDEDFHKVCSNFFAISSAVGGLLTISEVVIYSEKEGANNV